MIDITRKPATLREATATALVTVIDPATITALKEKRVPGAMCSRAPAWPPCSV